VRAGGWRRRLGPGGSLRVPLWPGPAGRLAVRSLGRGSAALDPVDLQPLRPDDATDELATAMVVPLVAATPGLGGALWRTDLVVCNPQAGAVPLEGTFLATDQPNPVAPVVRGDVPPGRCLAFEDVLHLPGLDGRARMGGLILRAAEGKGCQGDPCRFAALSRTYNTRAPEPEPLDEAIPGVPAGRGLSVGGWARFEGVDQDAGHRASVGLVSWADAPVTVRIVARDAGDREVASRTETVPPWGHRHLRVPGSFSRGAVRLEVLAGPPRTLVFPYVSVVDEDRAAATNQLPDATGGPPRALPLPPLPQPVAAGGSGG
jgi:hypothetical protein